MWVHSFHFSELHNYFVKLISLRTEDQILISQHRWSYPSKSGMTQETLNPSNPQSLPKLAQHEPPAVVEAVGLQRWEWRTGGLYPPAEPCSDFSRGRSAEWLTHTECPIRRWNSQKEQNNLQSSRNGEITMNQLTCLIGSAFLIHFLVFLLFLPFSWVYIIKYIYCNIYVAQQ